MTVTEIREKAKALGIMTGRPKKLTRKEDSGEGRQLSVFRHSN